MQEKIMAELITQGMYMLLHYQDKTFLQQVKDGVKKLAGRYVPPKDMIFWPTGLLANGLSLLVEDPLWGRDVTEALKQYFDRWIQRGMPLQAIDDVLSGNALLVLYEQTKEETYMDGARQMAEYLYQAAAESGDKKSSLPYRPAHQNQHIYVDGAAMSASFLLHYGQVCKEERATWLGVVQLENMLAYGMCEKNGLPYHGYQYESGKKYGIIGWGRAVGWLLLGLSKAITFLPKNHHSYKELAYQYCNLLEQVLVWQREDGYFTWQLGAEEGPVDTSATAMIGGSLFAGLQSGVLFGSEEIAIEAMKKAAKAVLSSAKEGKIYDCSGECGGFGIYPQRYGAYPWSQGPGIELLLLAEKL